MDPLPTPEVADGATAPPIAPPPDAPERAAPIRANCPKCQGTLWSVMGSKWCTACGYRQPSGESEELAGSEAPDKEAPSAKGELALIRQMIPPWAWALLGGVAAVGLASLAAGMLLPPFSRERALWTTFQLAAGVISLVLAQVSVLGLLGLQRDCPGMLDLVFPDRVWRLALRRLPDTRKQVCWAAWSVAALVFAPLLVGGLEYWLPKKGELKAKVQVAKALNAIEKPKDPKVETSRCVLVGYLLKDDQLTGLVVATEQGDELQYAGTIYQELPPEQKEEVLKRLAPLKGNKPVFPGVEGAVVWLKVQVSCEVEHLGYGEDLLLKEPKFKAFVGPKETPPDATAAEDPPPDDATAPRARIPAKGRPGVPAAKPKPGRAAPKLPPAKPDGDDGE